jgi:transcriptional regulator with XRE-family HTH domain
MFVDERIRSIREKQKISQPEAAARAGFSSTFLARVETGRTVPTVEELQQIARALAVPLHLLFYDPARRLPFRNLSPGVSADDIVRIRKE